MLRTITTKTLRDGRRSMLFWTLGIAALNVLIVLVYPLIETAPQFDELLGDLPDWVVAIIGEGELTSPAGYLNSQLFAALLPILFIAYVGAAGSGAIAGEEESHTLDLLLANPVSRTRVVVEKALAMTVGLAWLGLVSWASVVLPAMIIDMDIGAEYVAAVTLSAVLLGYFMGGLALAVGAATGSRGLSIGIVVLVAVMGYLLNALAPLVEEIEALQRISPFYYFYANDPLRNGLDAVHVTVLGGGAAIFVVIAVLGFRRRDVGV